MTPVQRAAGFILQTRFRFLARAAAASNLSSDAITVKECIELGRLDDDDDAGPVVSNMTLYDLKLAADTLLQALTKMREIHLASDRPEAVEDEANRFLSLSLDRLIDVESVSDGVSIAFVDAAGAQRRTFMTAATKDWESGEHDHVQGGWPPDTAFAHLSSSQLPVKTARERFPSLRLMAAFGAADASAEKAFTCAAAIELKETMAMSGADDGAKIFALARKNGLVAAVSRADFSTKVCEIVRLMDNLATTATLNDTEAATKNKIREYILPARFNRCQPGPVGVSTEGGFVCCSCSRADCDGCFEECNFATEELQIPSFHHQGDVVFGEDCSGGGGDEDELRLDLAEADAEAVKTFLLSEPGLWTTAECTENRLELNRGGDNQRLAVQEEEGADPSRLVLAFSGTALAAFRKELLPTLAEMTSQREVCTNGDEREEEEEETPNNVELEAADGNDIRSDSPVNIEYDALDDAELAGHSIFDTAIETDGVAYADDHHDGSTSSSSDVTNGEVSRRPVRPQVKECEGCRKPFKNINCYYTHVKKCMFTRVPKELLKPAKTADGRFSCPGCKDRFFRNVGMCYIKHVTSCKALKKTARGLECKQCRNKFAGAKELKKHRGAKCRANQLKVISADEEAEMDPVEEEDDPVEEEDPVEVVAVVQPPAPSRHSPAAPAKAEKIKIFHRIVCKVGDYDCPLCGLHFRLNQPYGRHVSKLECIGKAHNRSSASGPPPTAPDKLDLTFATIGGGNGVVTRDRVPSLRLLCRGVHSRAPLISADRDGKPPLTVKDALEMYHTLRSCEKASDRADAFQYMRERHIFDHVKSVGDFFQQASQLNGVVERLEKRQWSQKLTTLLRLPFHDHLNATSTGGQFKVFEYPSGSMVSTLCVNCPKSGCPGCALAKVKQKEHSAAAVPKKDAIPNGLKSLQKYPSITVTKASSSSSLPPANGKKTYRKRRFKPLAERPTKPGKQQMLYFDKLGVWVTGKHIKEERLRLAKRFGGRTATFQELIKFELRKRNPPPPPPRKAAKLAKAPSKVHIPTAEELKDASSLQLLYFNATNKWKPTADLEKECVRVGKVLGFPRKLTPSELVAHTRGKPIAPPPMPKSAKNKRKKSATSAQTKVKPATKRAKKAKKKTAVVVPVVAVTMEESSPVPWMLPEAEDANPLAEAEGEAEDEDEVCILPD